ncbi:MULTISPECIES: hypothetical protein [Shewanella]|uniref:Uncharacterized protein n=1 Tax=Shewanella marisflavi TaxID=260364 RepID=A0ABX5WLA4_9GAMM|nr:MULTISPECIES: hypothetical protein [Shewanella]QDF75254.1 hypothetical protein FGA12_08845 [Shewanella marisflavi]
MVDLSASFDSKLKNQISFTEVSLDRIFFDDELEALINNANPFSSVKAVSEKNLLNTYPFTYLCYQSAMIGYQFRKRVKIVSGCFTAKTLFTAQAMQQLPEDFQVPIFILNKKPTQMIRRQMAQFDLTNNLINKCFVNDSRKIGQYLRAWFSKQAGKKSIYQSEEWQALYPELDTSKKLAEFLSISKKEL